MMFDLILSPTLIPSLIPSNSPMNTIISNECITNGTAGQYGIIYTCIIATKFRRVAAMK